MNCEFPCCKSEALNGKPYCYHHNRVYGIPTVKEPKKPIARKSDKAKSDDKEYKKIVVEMLQESKLCELLTPVCTKIAQGLHHLRKRTGFLTDREYLKRACNACNLWVEENPFEAKEMGLVVSKFN